MKKLLIASAVACALPVLAHADVTISGNLNAGLDSIVYAGNGGGDTQASTTRTTGVSDYGSQIKFAGNEDLGNGLKTIWLVTAGFNANGVTTPGSGSGLLADRETWVGLQSDSLGKVRMGKLNDVLLETESTDNLYGPRRDFGAQGGGNINTPLYEDGSTPLYGNVWGLAQGDGRAHNSIKYDLPGNLNGVSGQLQYIAGEKVTNGKEVDDLYGIHLQYTNAATNLFIGGAYMAQPNQGSNYDTGSIARVEAGYNGENLSVAFTFNHDSLYGDDSNTTVATLIGANTASHMTGNSYAMYAAYQFGAWKPQIELSHRNNVTVDGHELSSSSSEESFELDYSLSKRTTIVAGYAQLVESDGLQALQGDQTNKSDMTYVALLHSF